MRCTNRFYRFFAVTLVLCLTMGLCACGKDELSLDYKKYNSITETQTDGRVEGFSTHLAVTDSDVNGKTGFAPEDVVAAGLFDVNGEKVLYSKNVFEQMNPASLTKIMTAICAMKNCNEEDIIICSDNVDKLESGASVCGLKPGDQLTVGEALRFMLLPSANDAAIAIAEHVSGSVEEFAALMNEEASKLGATDTHFVNPHGLTADEHYTTAYDMYLISNEAIKYDLFNSIISMTDYSSVIKDRNGSEKTIEVKTSNKFLDGTYYPPENINVVGGKTGTTLAAGSCLALITKDSSGNPYIAVILKASDRGVLYDRMVQMLNEINSR